MALCSMMSSVIANDLIVLTLVAWSSVKPTLIGFRRLTIFVRFAFAMHIWSVVPVSTIHKSGLWVAYERCCDVEFKDNFFFTGSFASHMGVCSMICQCTSF